MKSNNDLDKAQALLAQDLTFIKQELADIKSRVTNHFVTREEFEPYKKIIQGMIGLVLISVGGAILTLVLIK